MSTSEVFSETDNGVIHRYGDPTNPPLLIIYSLVNQPAILDFSPERSMIARLINAGFCVYLLAWLSPGQARRFLSLSDYVLGDIADAVADVSHAHLQAPHLVGVCQGGVLALCHAAISATYPTTDTRHIRSLVTLATPVDTGHDHDRLAQLARAIDFKQLIQALGNVPGQGLAAFFASLKPFALGPQRYAGLAQISTATPTALTEFMRMERWMYDGPDLAGEAFVEFAQKIYQNNALANGELTLDSQAVDLANITVPVFNAYAEDDHLVPPAAAAGLAACIKSDYQQYALAGGHLGLFISARAHRDLYPQLIDWLKER
ncbi:MAG: alpha/beta fold hydrolase [Spiribacter sp.]|jgi:polyhydroxyalkanoate synthase|nr:alpha/beta fold hydrolase [Spiribacter sp.]MDR9489188.1 alpha/beta fold hydrolase [Spiribacter sp.]